jgi:hypothetical protein
MEFVSRWRLLDYDPNSLKVAKLASEAEARHREAWAGANISRRSCKHSTKIVKVVAGWCPWFSPSHWRVNHVKILVSPCDWFDLLHFCSFCQSLTIDTLLVL